MRCRPRTTFGACMAIPPLVKPNNRPAGELLSDALVEGLFLLLPCHPLKAMQSQACILNAAATYPILNFSKRETCLSCVHGRVLVRPHPSWQPGPRAEDGVWAPLWYKQVHQSSGFIASSHPYASLMGDRSEVRRAGLSLGALPSHSPLAISKTQEGCPEKGSISEAFLFPSPLAHRKARQNGLHYSPRHANSTCAWGMFCCLTKP